MERSYSTLWFRLDHSDHYLIWFTAPADNADGIETNERGDVPYFRNQTQLHQYMAENGLAPFVVEEPILHDLDALVHWLKLKKMKRARQVDCDELLTAWNLFDDVSRSVDGQFDSDKERTNKIYQKLYWGTNPSVFTPEGCWYVPLWSAEELWIIQEVLSDGLKMFRRVAKRVD
jgi:hypothetical protein